LIHSNPNEGNVSHPLISQSLWTTSFIWSKIWDLHLNGFFAINPNDALFHILNLRKVYERHPSPQLAYEIYILVAPLEQIQTIHARLYNLEIYTSAF
jgi:hypothetical protein